MTEQEAIDIIEANCMTGYDKEADHGNADEVLCTFLTELGYTKLVQAWEKVEKWYA